MEFKDKTKVSELVCCPPLQACKNCDTIDVKYQLPFRPQTQRGRVVPVEVLLHFRFERCSGELTLGDLAYTSTLMPGEQVRLFTSDRNTRWTFDSETNLSYRHETTSEESFLMAGMASAVSDLSIIENGNSRSSYSESAVSGGGAGLDLGFIQIGGSASASSFNAQSASEFARNFSQHAESSSRHVEAGVRAASSTSIGEVERRNHAEGESESHFEASSRLFKNPNRCHALTFFFYKMNKCQTLCFDLIAIERRVVDPASPTGAERRPALPSSKVTVLPKAVLSTNVNRLENGRIARASAAEESLDSASIARTAILGSRVLTTATLASVVEPISDTDRKAALAAVDKDLAAAGLIDQESGEVTKKAKARFSWKRETTLPTAGVIVKGCLDECNVCESELQAAPGPSSSSCSRPSRCSTSYPTWRSTFRSSCDRRARSQVHISHTFPFSFCAGSLNAPQGRLVEVVGGAYDDFAAWRSSCAIGALQMPILLVFGLLLGIIAVWFLLRHFRLARRGALRAEPFPDDWVRVLNRNVPLYRVLPQDLRDELHQHINVFLEEKTFEGCGGLTITDEIRVTIASLACVLLLNRNTNYFPGFSTILVYPETYVAPVVHRDGLVETVDESVRAGESWHQGPVVLSWADVIRGGSQTRDAYNVVLHEFAHKLDEENDESDGLPVLGKDSQYETWAEVLNREYGNLQADAERGEPTVLDEYAATSPSEFFAVATETFFEKPVELKEEHPLLYEELRKFYELDPSSWY